MDRLQVGDRVGNYLLERELERGGTFMAYRAKHQVLPRVAILKIVDTVPERGAAVQLLREACLLEALHHPGVIGVFEAGLHEHRPWFAVERVVGTSLTGLLAPGALDRVDALALLRDIAEVLAHACQRGVVSCGVRPSNILLTGRTRRFPLCLVDWSDARTHDAEASTYVPTAASWHYTAPELVSGDQVDDRVDVFALGVLAYQLVTGILPFDGNAVATAADGTKQHVPTEVRCPDAPRELTGLVDQMLAYDRWDRPSVPEVHAALTWLADDLVMRAQDVPPQVRIRQPRWTPPFLLEPVPGDPNGTSASPERTDGIDPE